MTTCPVCGAANEELAVVCTSCKGFMRAKVDTLDLFHTMWGLFEAPTATFRRIALSRIKNYTIPLSCCLGIAIAFMLFWNANLGVAIPQLTTLIGLGILTGPFLGLAVVTLLALWAKWLLRRMDRKIAFRNAFAVLAYAAVPVVISLVIVFPLEIAVFGIYFFDKNPPPIVLNPVAFIILVGIDAIAAGWSVVLSGIGMRALAGLSRLRSGILALSFAAVIGGLFLIPLR